MRVRREGESDSERVDVLSPARTAISSPTELQLYTYRFTPINSLSYFNRCREGSVELVFCLCLILAASHFHQNLKRMDDASIAALRGKSKLCVTGFSVAVLIWVFFSFIDPDRPPVSIPRNSCSQLAVSALLLSPLFSNHNDSSLRTIPRM